MKHLALTLSILFIVGSALTAQRTFDFKTRKSNCGNRNYSEIISVLGNYRVIGFQKNITPAFNNDLVNDLNINTDRIIAYGATLRGFTQNKIAIRIGLNVEKVNYTTNVKMVEFNDVEYSASRTDFVANIGVEKHFAVSHCLDVYGGPYIPMNLTGQSELEEENRQLEEKVNGRPFAGFGIVAGMNVEFFKVLRLGAELESNYSKFEMGLEHKDFNVTNLKYNQFEFNVMVTLGVAL